MCSSDLEEQFYALWPTVTKWRGRSSVLIASLILIPVSLAIIGLRPGDPGGLWYNTFVEFLFFAPGGLLALALHKRDTTRYPAALRCIVGACGLALWAHAARTRIGSDPTPADLPKWDIYAGYLLAAAGCTLIMLAIIGIPRVPVWLRYLGKISYGLYVFHLGVILFARWLWSKLMTGPPNPFVIDPFSLALCIGLAALSYHFLESPFLRLKERFAFVRSRPA